MNQYPQIVPVNTKITTNIIFIALLEEHFLEDPAVPFRQLFQDASNYLYCLLSNSIVQGIDTLVIGQSIPIFFLYGGFAGWSFTGRTAVVLHQNMIANRDDIGTKAFRMAQAAIAPYHFKHPSKRFLAQVRNLLRG